MRLLKKTNINFLGKMKPAFILSGAFLFLTIVSLFYHPLRSGIGPNFSIDFLGGTVVQLKFDKPVVQDLGKIRNIVNNLGYGSAEVKRIGAVEDNELQFIVKKKASMDADASQVITAALAKDYPDNSFQLRRAEHVGPRIGKELQEQALIAILLALIAIIIYIGFRFNLPFGVASVVALFHDVLFTVGIFSLFNFEISLPIVAALLTIVGFSINDTIVIFDRIRENVGNKGLHGSFEEKCNLSINQTLSRTIITTGTTLVVTLVLYAFFFRSGDVIEYFSIAMIAGLISGTYSTVFIATAIGVLWNRKWPYTMRTIHYNK